MNAVNNKFANYTTTSDLSKNYASKEILNEAIVTNSLTISNQRFTRDQLEASGWEFVANDVEISNPFEEKYFQFAYQTGSISFSDRWSTSNNHFLIYVDDASDASKSHALEINVVERFAVKGSVKLRASVEFFDGPDEEYPLTFPSISSTRFVLTINDEDITEISSGNLRYEIYRDGMHSVTLSNQIFSRLENLTPLAYYYTDVECDEKFLTKDDLSTKCYTKTESDGKYIAKSGNAAINGSLTASGLIKGNTDLLLSSGSNETPHGL